VTKKGWGQWNTDVDAVFGKEGGSENGVVGFLESGDFKVCKSHFPSAVREVEGNANIVGDNELCFIAALDSSFTVLGTFSLHFSNPSVSTILPERKEDEAPMSARARVWMLCWDPTSSMERGGKWSSTHSSSSDSKVSVVSSER
jgi:hypothetical protein